MREILFKTGFLFLIFTGFSGMMPYDSSEYIYWSSDRKLTWNDFQGAPNYHYEDIGALTSSGIMQSKTCSDGMIEFEIQAYFEKNHSWVKEVARTDHHLRHEQIHFDITELYARKLNDALKEKAFTCEQEEEFEAFVNKYYLHWESRQINYDLYTQYSMRPDRQKEWEYLVAMELSMHEPCHGEHKDQH